MGIELRRGRHANENVSFANRIGYMPSPQLPIGGLGDGNMMFWRGGMTLAQDTVPIVDDDISDPEAPEQVERRGARGAGSR